MSSVGWDRNKGSEWGKMPEGERRTMALGAMLAIVGLAVVGCAICFGLGIAELLPEQP